MSTSVTPDSLGSTREAFALVGQEMRTHKGRSVVQLKVDGRTCYLKRVWFAPSQIFRRVVRQGFHELAMIDWLNANGFNGPRVIARGYDRLLLFRRRLFFLMEEVPGERPLEATWIRHQGRADGLIEALASFAARLHDAGFVHTDFSERHILVGGEEGRWTFRLIDLERARTGNGSEQRAANDLKTLAASIADEQLRQVVRTEFVDLYVGRRRRLAPGLDFRTLFDRARPTKTFQ